ncbi:GNAT family N-acetyltransferase [Tateyamaria sp. ANG-S1]|uniref:GNAT family N-acetyltransferase n=1 Tax=Tateyamaria sp. ANG-S1 TaxID=1577905 RepID=UPI0009E47473|nr:GNAT family N-acetyltransferase [Tateyamaria sp. ANG-S1]
MTTPSRYTFRTATLDDLALLKDWQSNRHVSAWWDTDTPYEAADLDNPLVRRWIVSTNNRSFAFIQDYTVHGWEDHHFAGLPKGSRGIDQFIGEPDMVGIGHGSAFIGQHMRSLFDAGAPVIATDPHPQNGRAIAVYTKLGFAPLGPRQDTTWGLILPMIAHPQTISTPL